MFDSIDMMGLRSPCMDCDHKGCGSYHDQCEAFKAYRAELKKRKADQNKYNDLNAYVKTLSDTKKYKEWRGHNK